MTHTLSESYVCARDVVNTSPGLSVVRMSVDPAMRVTIQDTVYRAAIFSSMLSVANDVCPVLLRGTSGRCTTPEGARPSARQDL
jgi:hypothetical protein